MQTINDQKYRYYAAYGSNTNLAQMGMRCPEAIPVGTSFIKDYRLSFKGSQSGSYFTIEKADGEQVPIVIWRVTKEDIEHLNMYEGYPSFYGIKKFKDVPVHTFIDQDVSLEVFAYIMKEGRPYGMPSIQYIKCCSDGFDRFGIDQTYIDEALEYSRSKM